MFLDHKEGPFRIEWPFKMAVLDHFVRVLSCIFFVWIFVYLKSGWGTIVNPPSHQVPVVWCIMTFPQGSAFMANPLYTRGVHTHYHDPNASIDGRPDVPTTSLHEDIDGQRHAHCQGRFPDHNQVFQDHFLMPTPRIQGVFSVLRSPLHRCISTIPTRVHRRHTHNPNATPV